MAAESSQKLLHIVVGITLLGLVLHNWQQMTRTVTPAGKDLVSASFESFSGTKRLVRERVHRSNSVNLSMGKLPDYLLSIAHTEEDQNLEKLYEEAMRKGPKYYFQFLADTSYPIPKWKPGRAKPIVCDGMEYYSGHFSIPSENIIETVQPKTKDWAQVIPGRKETYVFKKEEDYRKDLEISRFAITRRRYGFATNRNLEIMAAGSIPYFCGIEKVPRIGTLRSLPKEFFQMIVLFPGVRSKCFPPKKAVGHPLPEDFNQTQYLAAAHKLLDYTKHSMTTTHHALYVLSATSLTQLPRSVLVLWASHYTIMLTGFIHGLRRLGVRVEDVPRRPEVYKGEGCEAARKETYAKGWFFFCRTEESENLTRTNISERILEKEFDLIVISVTDTLTYYMKDPYKDIPFYEEVLASYPRDRILTLNDADLIKSMQADVAHKMMHNTTLYFKRETHGCHEKIW